MKKQAPHDKLPLPPPTHPPLPPKAPAGTEDVVTVTPLFVNGQSYSQSSIGKSSLRDMLPSFGDADWGVARTPAQHLEAYSKRRSSAGKPSNSDLDDARAWSNEFAASRQLSPETMTFILTRLVAEYEREDVLLPPGNALPEAAPELWTGRDLNLRENAPQFIRRVYGPWLGHGLTRKQIKARDPELYRALSVWLTRHPDDDIVQAIPRQSDLLDELIDRLSGEFSIEDLRKLGYAINARLRRDGRT